MIDIRKIKNGYWWKAQEKFESLVSGEDKLLELTMQITDRCNMNCPKCNKRNFTNQDMLATDVLRIIEDACVLGLKHIHFTGGEPTLHPDFANFINYSKGMGLRVDMSTNGKFDVDKAREIVEAGIDSINVSWDHLGVVPECISYIEQFDVKVFVNRMVMPSNYQELYTFLEFMKSVSYIVDIQLMPPRGDAVKFTREQIIDFNENWAEKCYEASKGRFPMVEHKVLTLLADEGASEGIYHKPITWPCHRAKSELRVGAKGFTTCTYLYRDGHVTCGLNQMVEAAWHHCMKECARSVPPIKGMCDKSCSPEVCYFNYFVEQSVKGN